MDSQKRQEVVITDIDIPFWSMAELIFKWMLASIPAAIVFLGLVFTVGTILGTFAGS